MSYGCPTETFGHDKLIKRGLGNRPFILGPERGMELIRSLPGIEGVIVDNNGNVHYSEGIEKK